MNHSARVQSPRQIDIGIAGNNACLKSFRAWRQHALCRRYHVAVLTSSTVTVCFDDGMQDLQIGWGLGFLPNTEAEVLFLSKHVEAADAIVRDLHDRGVERIALVVDAGWHLAAPVAPGVFFQARSAPSTEAFVRTSTASLRRSRREAAKASLRAAFGGDGEDALVDAVRATEQSRTGGAAGRHPSRVIEARLLRESLFALPDLDRRFVLAADRTVTVLLEELARAVQRNGYFLNQDAAIEFVAKALLGAERRMDRERASIAAQVRTPRAASVDCLADSRAV